MNKEPERWAVELRDAVELALDGMDPELAALTIQRVFEEQTRKLREALVPFERHGVACGAFANDPGPFWIMTYEGHRDVPVEDFLRARQALKETPNAQ